MSIVSTLTPLMDSARKYFEVDNKLSIADLINLFNPNKNLLKGSAVWSNDVFVNFNNHIVLTDETYNGYKVVHCSQAWNSPQAVFNLKGGKTYTFSVYAKSDKDGEGANIYSWLTNEPYYSIPANINGGVKLTTEWKRYSITFVPNMDFKSHIRMEQFANCNLYLAGYKLEEGSLATPLETVGGVVKAVLSALHLERRCLA